MPTDVNLYPGREGKHALIRHRLRAPFLRLFTASGVAVSYPEALSTILHLRTGLADMPMLHSINLYHHPRHLDNREMPVIIASQDLNASRMLRSIMHRRGGR